MRFLITLSMLALTGGCQSSRSPEPATAPPTDATTTAPVAPVIAPPSSEPVEEAKGPSVRCAAQADGGGERPSLLCGLCRANRSEPLLQLVPADTLDVPSGAAVLAQKRAGPNPRDLEYTIALGRDALIAQVFDCPGCRRKMGWGFSVTFDGLRALDDDNRRALQKALGFAESPLLGSYDDWRGAKPVAPPLATPELPGCKP